MANRAVLLQHHYLRTLNRALRATSTKIGVLGVSSTRNEKHNYSPPPAVRTDWTPVDFSYPPVTPVSEALDQIMLDTRPITGHSYNKQRTPTQHPPSIFHEPRLILTPAHQPTLTHDCL